MNINEHVIQIMGGRKNLIHTEKPLKIGEDINLKIEGTVQEITDIDNHDGTIDRVYKVKGIYCEEL